MYVTMRVVSLLLIVVAIVLMGGDVITTLEKGGDITVRSGDQIWTILNSHSADVAKAWMEHRLPAALTHGVYVSLALPAWAITGVPGVILAFVFGRRH
jgi:hypothetical protein